GRENGATFFDEKNEKNKYFQKKIFGINFKIHYRTVSKIVYTILSLNGRRKIKYAYNNLNPGGFTLSAWLGRQLPLIIHLKIAAQENINIFEKLVWEIAVNSEKKKHDDWALTWAMCKVAEGTDPIMDETIKKFRKRFAEKYPHGM